MGRKRKEVSKETIKLDIACGQNKEPGFVGIDIYPKADIVHNLLEFPWPIESKSVSEARMIHFFEHVPNNLRFKFMDELWRILIPGASCLIISPYYSSMRAIQDPTHEWPPISETSFLYFNKQWRVDNKLDHYPVTCDFDFSYGYALDPIWNLRNLETRTFAVKQYINSVTDLQVILTKRGE
jgi:hypothetical protein